MMTAETTNFFMTWELLAAKGSVREIVSRPTERISQFLNFDENMPIQRIVISISGSYMCWIHAVMNDRADATWRGKAVSNGCAGPHPACASAHRHALHLAAPQGNG